MALKKEQLSQEEKVAAILKKVNKANVGTASVTTLDISSKCKRCGRTLSALERITFYDRCADCTSELAANSREQFFKRYVMLAIVYITGLLLAVFLSGSEGSVSQLLGKVFQAIVTGVSVMYVAYKILPRILTNAKQKTILLISMGFAVGVDSIVMAITVSIGKNILFYCCCAAFLAFVVYDAYHDYGEINHRYNLLSVYRRKSLDEEYVKEVSEIIKTEPVVKKDVSEVKTVTLSVDTDVKPDNVSETAVDETTNDTTLEAVNESAVISAETDVSKVVSESTLPAAAEESSVDDEDTFNDWMI